MKKNLCSFLAVLAIINYESSYAFRQDFGLNSTSKHMKLFNKTLDDEYRQSVFALPIPRGATGDFFNKNRQHFKPNQNPITGIFNQANNCLLNQDEFEMLFLDSDIDMPFYKALESVEEELKNLDEAYKDISEVYITYQPSIEIKQEGSESTELDKRVILRELKEVISPLVKNTDIFEQQSGKYICKCPNLMGLQRWCKGQNGNYYKDIIENIEKIENFLVELSNILNLTVEEYKNIEDFSTYKEVLNYMHGTIQLLQSSLKVLLDKEQGKYKNLKLSNLNSSIQTDKKSEEEKLKNRVIYESEDPRLNYILDFNSYEKFGADTLTNAAKENSIFANLKDKEKRDQFRKNCGFSWKDMLDLLTHELFVARNRGNLLVQHFLTAVVQDIYDTPEAWVPIEGDANEMDRKIECVKDDAKRLAFLIAEGQMNRLAIRRTYQNPNIASVEMNKYIAAIEKVTDASLKDYSQASKNNSLTVLFNAKEDALENTVQQLTNDTIVDDRNSLYNDTHFAHFNQIVDQNSIQKKEKIITNTCCLNSLLDFYCRNNWIDGLFYLNRKAQENGMLNDYFKDLRNIYIQGDNDIKTEAIALYGKVMYAPDSEGKLSQDKTSDTEKLTQNLDKLNISKQDLLSKINGTAFLAIDAVNPFVGLHFGANVFYNNEDNSILTFNKQTVFGPTLAIYGNETHFYKQRFSKLGTPYPTTNFDFSSQKTYMEFLKESLHNLNEPYSLDWITGKAHIDINGNLKKK